MVVPRKAVQARHAAHLGGVRDLLGPDDILEDFLGLSLVLVMDDSGAINHVNSLGESHVLPGLGLSRNRGCTATLLLHNGIDY